MLAVGNHDAATSYDDDTNNPTEYDYEQIIWRSQRGTLFILYLVCYSCVKCRRLMLYLVWIVLGNRKL